MILFLLAACTLSHHPEAPAPQAAADVEGWDALVAGPGVLEHETVVSARWAVPLKGLVNLDHPAAAALENGETPMVLTVHVLRHPEHGTWIIDTGVHEGLYEGVALRGLVKKALGGMVVEETLASIAARQPEPIAGVLITHMHADHVLGLPDLPLDTPIYVGPQEQAPKSLQNAALRGTYSRLLDGRGPLRVWDYGDAGAVDVLGDGSLWALDTPGHTPGSTSFLAHTTAGPVLFTGDTSHTIWGWENGVEPGGYTLDQATNATSLAALKELVAAHPDIRVIVGHETDGVGTGVDDTVR